MSKRPASSSSSVTGASPKRQKTNGNTDDDAPTFAAPIEESAAAPEITVEATGVEDAAPAQDSNDAVAVPEPAEAETKTKGKGKKAKTPKQPPVKDAFKPWKPTPPIVDPAKNDFWGIKPVTGDPRPHADQPAARTSDAATNPPMWEERNYRFKRGSRYVKYQGPIKPEGADAGPDIDQEDFMVMKLIDMRPVSKHDQSPRRTPTHYVYEHGKPKDWNNMQAVKALNDRRGQAIDRATLDAPWTKIERDYLSQLINGYPDASIWELTERHNDRFMGQDFTGASGFTFTKLSEGRTVESVRAEYMTYKPAYDGGEPPKSVRWRTDKSAAGKALTKANDNKMHDTFGKPNKGLEKEFDEASGGSDDGSDDESDGEGRKTPKKSTPQKKKADKTPKNPKTPKTPKKETTKKPEAKKETPKAASPKATDKDSSDSDDEGEIQIQTAQQMAAQPRLDDDDEALLDLAGINNPEEIRNHPPHVIPSITPPRRAFSWSSGSDLSDVNTDKPDSPAPTKAAKSRASSLANDAELEDAVAAVSGEAVANAVAAQQPRSAAPSVHEPSEHEVVVAQQTLVQQTVTVQQQTVRAATPERSSPAPAQAPRTPSPKAAREVVIDDNYDDGDDGGDEDVDDDDNDAEGEVLEFDADP